MRKIVKHKCLICDIETATINSHVLKKHSVDPKEYYVKYIGELKYCICGKELRFERISAPYANEFCYKCGSDQSLDMMIKKYGDVDGRIAHKQCIDKKKYSNSKEGLIKKFGIDGYNKILGKNNGHETLKKKREDPEYNKLFLEKQTTRIEFYLNQGYSQEESKKLLSERQRTFTLDKCIERYGEICGRERWSARQEKWQTTLKSKTEDELKRINSLKSVPFHKRNLSHLFSKKEILCFDFIEKLLSIKLEYQYKMCTDQNVYFYDAKYLDVIIEYNGMFWHCDRNKYEPTYYHPIKGKTAKEIWEDDRIKNGFALSQCYRVFVINEIDFDKDPNKITEELKRFIYED